VLLADHRQALTADLLRRMRGALGESADRMQALPRLPEADYLNLVAVADVVLDTPHYGGGANTVYDAFAVGTPVLTLPGAWHRGRWAMAAYNRLGIADAVAADTHDYVRRAVRLGTDPEARRALGERLRETAGELFEDAEAVREHAEFFRQVAADSRH
jgi:predicted O-linked N-acetylglucosamine transferase (SPINDLY family)